MHEGATIRCLCYLLIKLLSRDLIASKVSRSITLIYIRHSFNPCLPCGKFYSFLTYEKEFVLFLAVLENSVLPAG